MVSLKLPENAVTRALRDWKTLLRTARPVSRVAVLGRRYIYILPTRQGMLFAVVLVCMLIGSINYALNLGFVLTFLLAGLGVIAMLHTWRNLAELTIEAGKTLPVFAGEAARFNLIAADNHRRARYAVAASCAELPPVFFDRYQGPQFGVAGTRRLADVWDRPMIGTIIKPSVGMSPEATAAQVETLVAAGVDFSLPVPSCDEMERARWTHALFNTTVITGI